MAGISAAAAFPLLELTGIIKSIKTEQIMNHKSLYFIAFIFLAPFSSHAQDKSLVNTSESPYAKLRSVDMDDVSWTGGFWGERFETVRTSMAPSMWRIYNDPEISHAFRNFEIAAELEQGEHSGPSFHDGDFYKTLEAMASLYAVTQDETIDRLMDKAIPVIVAAQREDGYIHTPTIISQRKDPESARAFQDQLNFETYNLGHLMTAACIHYRATGKTALLEAAKKAADYLYNFYKQSSPELARSTICPSHYMGVVEMYRTAKEPRYLELAKDLINIRGLVEGTDDNQDRIPFREQTKAMGHAVRANYLYAGAADVYAETGDETLMKPLEMIWDNMIHRKMYVTGAFGALYDGVSPDGTSYNPSEIQKIHQAFGRDYQLPNLTAHNESCANIGSLLWNWRMFQITGDAKFMDIMELSLYNSILAGASLDGRKFFYTNPLAVSHKLPYTLRWSKEREEYISLSNCCPPNTFRTLSQIHAYAYSLSEQGIWVNLYGSNRLDTRLDGKRAVKLRQETNYPWDGKIALTIEQAPKQEVSLFFRIPGWCKNAEILVNGEPVDIELAPGKYAQLARKWKKGDAVALNLPMEARLLESNPLVEETRNQAAVKRGPVVYCLESVDLPGHSIFEASIPLNAEFSTREMEISGRRIMALETNGFLIDHSGWEGKLYREAAPKSPRQIPLTLIPYFAWGNRGRSEMTVWIPLDR